LYLLLAALLLTVWRGRRIGGYLIAACLVSAAWGAVLVMQMGGAFVNPWLLFSIEVVRTGVWILFLGRLLQELGGSRAIRYLGQTVWLGVLAAGFGLREYSNSIGVPANVGQVLFPGGLLIALTGLVLIEQLYRNSPAESRWSLKLLVLGLGGIFAYDLFLFSQAVLFNALDEASWLARGPVNILFIPLIALAARRNPDWELRIFVSRQVVFYTTALSAVGLYLLLMSFGGYLLVLYGGTWGSLAQVLFLAGSVIVLAALLFSGSLRAKLKVFLSKHFFQNKYDYREEWLRLISTLSAYEDDSTREVVIEAIARIVGSPSGFLWTLDRDGRSYRLAATYKTIDSLPDLALDDPVIRFMQEEGWLVDLAEYAREPDRYGDLQLPNWLSGRKMAWLIIPLMYGKQLSGVVLLHQAPGSPKLNYEDRDLLKTVGNHIAVHLAQEQSDSLLTEAKQFEAYNRLTAFLMHDLNNLIAQQSLIVKNAEKHKRNPDFVDDAIDTITNSVERMNKVMNQLKRGKAERSTRRIPISDVVSDAVARCAGRQPVPVPEVADDFSVSSNAEEFTMVLSHVIRNAQDATPGSGSVKIWVGTEINSGLIRVTDNGAGMSDTFIRDRLFRPFDSTKGVEGMGIGAYQAREFARKLGGDMVVESEPQCGTTVTIQIPLE
jgi:putative PEP-CTERM system histidine kinase